MITTIVLIKADPKRIPEAAIKLAGIEGVQEVYSVSGEWDLVAIVKVAEYEAVMLIGGRAPEFLRHEPKVVRIVKEFHQRRKWIFSICHGIQILIAAGLVKNRKLTCYRNVRLELELAGGRWVDRQSVVDDRLITSQTWESHPEFYRDIFKNLERK